MCKDFLACSNHWRSSGLKNSALSWISKCLLDCLEKIEWTKCAVECWIKRYVCRRGKADLTKISLNSRFTVEHIFSWITGRHDYWAVCFSWCTLNPIKKTHTTFWETIWAMNSKFDLTSADLMQRKMKKIIYTNSAGGTFSSFQEKHPQKQLWNRECRQPWCFNRAASLNSSC